MTGDHVLTRCYMYCKKYGNFIMNYYIFSAEMPACLAKFDTKFRACMTQNQIVPDQYFKFLANSTDGLQMSFNQLNQTICS